MKPKTKLQKQIVALSDKLPRATKVQEEWAYKHCLNHEATRLKSGRVTCLDCGHQWKDEHPLITTLSCTCPNCDTCLKVKDTRKQKFDDWSYFGIITTFKGFQVFRLYKVHGIYKTGKPVFHNFYEVSQIWLAPDGKFEIIGYIHQTGWYVETWTGEFELRARNTIYNYDIEPYKVYPRKSILEEVERNGFNGKTYGYSTFGMFYMLLSNSKFETLLKAEQFSLIKYSKSHMKDIEACWSAIRICLRNKYKITDTSLYIDYIKFLQYFDKDIRNPHFACPSDLMAAHDYWMKRKRKAEDKIKFEEKRLKALKDEVQFKKLKGKFFGIAFSEGDMEVATLDSVLDYITEGDVMHHCVGSYALKEHAIILSARVNGERIETVEVSLKTFEVVQSRGLQNKNTAYHDRIISLVNQNMHLIKERMKPKKKQRLKSSTSLKAAAV